MDVGLSFRYVFDDEEWLSKLLLGLIVSIIPIVNLAWAGYLVQLVRNVSDDLAEPLPDWSDFGDKFVKGLVIFVVGIIYALPVLFLLLILVLGGVITGISMNSELQNLAIGTLTGVSILVLCLVALYILGFSFFFPAVTIHYSRQNTFGSCFEVGKIIKLVTQNLGVYLVVWLVTLVILFALSFLSGIGTLLFAIPCIGVILGFLFFGFLAVWPNTVIAHLFGQVGAIGLGTGE
jgi:hypothetical protein